MSTVFAQEFALPTGVKIPATGFGVFQIPPAETADAVAAAIEAGYRHIDTAQSYFNEAEVGAGIRQSGIARSELFVTTKMWVDNFAAGQARASIEQSLEKLGVEYLDLMLLHQPFNDVYAAWRDLIAAQEAGLVRTIGVSNFTPGRVHDLGSFTGVYPQVNQIEINPFHQQVARVTELQKRGVVVEAWAPFAEGKSGLFSHPLLTEIGAAYGKTVAQVVLQWLYQRGIVSLAKSVHPERMQQNLDFGDFELNAQDLERIAALDLGASQFLDHDDPATVDLCKGWTASAQQQ